MEKLVESGLFGEGLIRVDNAERVARYNECLDLLGIAPTELSEFRVDGIGWSPEIAEEKDDRFYLSAGPANPMGIVVGPDQRNRPIYFPYQSYDRLMMAAYFEQFGHPVADITSSVCIGLDIDQELTSYRTPLDLLLVDDIIVRTVACGITDSAGSQRALVERLQAPGMDWADAELRNQVIESAQRYGDLRFLQTEIPELRFEVPNISYTQAFGGTFVFRGMSAKDGFTVLNDPAEPDRQGGGAKMIALTDEDLVSRLEVERIVEVNLAWYAEHPEALDEIHELLTGDFILSREPDCDYSAMNRPRRKRLLASMEADIPEVLHELERLARELDGYKRNPYGRMSAEAKRVLVRPHSRLSEHEQEVVWRLIVRWNRWNMRKAFEVDKNNFYENYREWPEGRKKWAISLLKPPAAAKPAGSGRRSRAGSGAGGKE